MPDSGTDSGKARRWRGLVCPDCRCVFRVPKDHDGAGVICPSCRRMLRIPGEGDVSAPLMALQGESEEEVEKEPERNHTEEEIPALEQDPVKRQTGRPRGMHGFQMFAFWLSAAAAVAFALFLFMEDRDTPGKPEPSGDIVEARDDFEDLVKGNQPPPDVEPAAPAAVPAVLKRGEAEFLKLAEPLAGRFLSAESVEDILPLVHNPEGVSRKIRAYYPEGVIEPVEISKFNPTGKIGYRDNAAVVGVRTAGFERKQLIFVDGEDGLKIDWESWVGWSEMPWDEIFGKKPGQPVLVRVFLRSVDYYNFDFVDEEKWRSYILTTPDGEGFLYGYAETDSLLAQRLRPADSGVDVAMTLKIRFPEGSRSANQVVIEECVADSWLVQEEAE